MKFGLLILFVFMLSACSDKVYRPYGENILLSSTNKALGSTTTGNLVATAIKEANDLDVVLYPSDLLDSDKYALLKPKMSSNEMNDLLDIFPNGVQDQFIVGTMKGSDIKDLILGRVNDTYRADVQVAGIHYHVHLIGGLVQYAYFNNDDNQEFDEKRYYRVGLSNFFYFSGETFPSYKYRNGVSHSLKFEEKLISVKESLIQYFSQIDELPFLDEPRAKVSHFVKEDSGNVKIYNIQGNGHRSPIYGHRVTTSGIVTASGNLNWYPGGYEFYLQDPKGDGNNSTSDAIHVHLSRDDVSLELGDLVEVKGVVYEEMTGSGLSRTSIKDVSSFKVIKKGIPLPAAVILGNKGRKIPDQTISTYRGDLNYKPYLDLNDGVDFWESLEGMRVAISNPKVVGFRGGNEEYESQKPKGNLSIYMVPDGDVKIDNMTSNGGVIPNFTKKDHNPEIIQITNNHMTRGLETSRVYNVGEQINGDLIGVMSYEKNLFGGGEYTLVLPQTQTVVTSDYAGRGMVKLEDRPKTKLVSNEDHLTVATYNVENLSGNQEKRLKEIAKSIRVNLKCPDILNLVEIQDFNGIDFGGGSSAEETLSNLISYLECDGRDYKTININPLNHNEGGQPGGNIRVAMIYDANRVTFNRRANGSSMSETRIMPNGSLNQNPGRIFPNDPAFRGTRKSLVAEFEFRGEKIFVMGNHFNSKLGDTSPWSNMQPPIYGSEIRRARLAEKVNDFVQIVERFSPGAHVVVLGDFNAYIEENPMQVLAGDQLSNLVSYGNLVPENDRYSTNHNGNSQPLDYIFVNKKLLERNPEVEILHFNSDFMGRLSDHDPVISRFAF